MSVELRTERARGLAGDDVLSGARVQEIYVMLTFACNIRCPICPYWGTTGVSYDKQKNAGWHDRPWNPETFRRFLTGMRAFGPRNLNISGGEPLATKHWKQACRIGREAGYTKIELTTNGSFLRPNAYPIADRVDVLQVSFTDPGEWKRGFGEHGWEWDLRAIFDTIKSRNPKVDIVMNIAVSNESAPQLDEMVDRCFAADLPLTAFRVVHPMWLDPNTLDRHKVHLSKSFATTGEFWHGFGTMPSEVDLDGLRATLLGLRERHPMVQVWPELDADELEPYYRDATYLPRRYRHFCAAPWQQLEIIPNGDVWVCYDVCIGNIHDQSAEEIWNGEAARALRSRVLEGGLFAGCAGCFNKYSQAEPS